jgi:hypothetical protein
MSAAPPGETDAFDLAAETLQFVVDNWADQATAVNRGEWDRPILHHGNEKREYPNDADRAKDISLRDGDLVTATYAGATSTVEGSAFNLRREAEVDVEVEAYLGSTNGVVESSNDFQRLVWAVRRSILSERTYPVTNPDCLVEYHWLTITNETAEPIEDDNRDYFNHEFTVQYHGLEVPP